MQIFIKHIIYQFHVREYTCSCLIRNFLLLTDAARDNELMLRGVNGELTG